MKLKYLPALNKHALNPYLPGTASTRPYLYGCLVPGCALRFEPLISRKVTRRKLVIA